MYYVLHNNLLFACSRWSLDLQDVIAVEYVQMVFPLNSTSILMLYLSLNMNDNVFVLIVHITLESDNTASILEFPSKEI